MLGQTPGSIRFEHAILQHEVLGVAPVVGNLPRIVIAHHVGRLTADAIRIDRKPATTTAALRLRDEAIHLAPADVGLRVALAMRSTAVEVVDVVIGCLTTSARWIGHAHRWHSIAHRDAIRSGKSSKVAVKGSVLFMMMMTCLILWIPSLLLAATKCGWACDGRRAL